MLAPEKSLRFNNYITMLFDIQHNERSLSAMNPLVAAHFKVSAGIDGYEPRLLDFSFYRIFDDSRKKVLHVMAVTRDNTRLAALAKELRALKEQNQQVRG